MTQKTSSKRVSTKEPNNVKEVDKSFREQVRERCRAAGISDKGSTDDLLEQLTKRGVAVRLQKLCRAKGISATGPTPALTKRLTKGKFDGKKCSVCSKPVEILKRTGIAAKVLPDGKILFTATMRCIDKNWHTCPVEIIM